jgi:hypothetical protein
MARGLGGRRVVAHSGHKTPNPAVDADISP